jgi:hypothetical protein
VIEFSPPVERLYVLYRAKVPRGKEEGAGTFRYHSLIIYIGLAQHNRHT